MRQGASFIMAAALLLVACWWPFLCWATGISVSVPAVGVQKDEFIMATAAFNALLRDPKRSDYRADWQALEERFVAFYKCAPQSLEAAKALYYAGRIYEELGCRSSGNTDWRIAMDYYHHVTTYFPDHPWADDALLRKAYIEQRILRDHVQARADLEQLLAYYPTGDTVSRARELLRGHVGVETTATSTLASKVSVESSAEQDLVTKLAIGNKSILAKTERRESEFQLSTLPSLTAVAFKIPTSVTTGTVIPLHGRRSVAVAGSKPCRLKDIRYQSSDDYTRITLELDRKVSYHYEILPAEAAHGKPTRLYIDLEKTLLGDKLRKQGQLAVADGILRQVRAGQNTLMVARVVLDFQAVQRFNFFVMESKDGYRLVVDVFAPSKTVLVTAVPEPEPSAIRMVQKQGARYSVGTEENFKSVGRQPQLDNVRQSEASGPVAVAAQTASARVPGGRVGDLKVDRDFKLPPRSRKKAGTLVEQLGLTVATIVIDPGHGGKDPGAQSCGLTEKSINLRFAKILGNLLKQCGFNVFYTRTIDVFIPLEERTAMANVRKADLFISVHCNSYKNDSIKGLETYYLNLADTDDAVRVAARENAVTSKKISDLQAILTDLMLNSKMKESRDLAKSVHGCMVQHLKGSKCEITDHRVRSAPFYVLMGAIMPAVLIELGYLTNPEEARRLASDAYLARKAQGLVDGIMAYKHQIERFAET
ncbi:N-acetylmuramoyl-L-alanine amidase [Desulfovibrionales bacterium]